MPSGAIIISAIHSIPMTFVSLIGVGPTAGLGSWPLPKVVA